MIEIYKDIPGWPDYQVSNFGNIKSLKRNKESALRLSILTTGYLKVDLSNNGARKYFKVHQLVAMAFLGHKPNGNKFVVNHKDFNKLNNRLDNLEIVTNRENTNRKHLQSTSKYTGVCWSKRAKKWHGQIIIKGQRIHLGYFSSEISASKAYQSKLLEI